MNLPDGAQAEQDRFEKQCTLLATLAAQLYPHVQPGEGESRVAIAVGEAAELVGCAYNELLKARTQMVEGD
jgi:hypothetical protein